MQKEFFDASRIERGLNHLIVWQVVYKDKQRYLLPILYVLRGSNEQVELIRFSPLIDYCIEHSAKSNTWFLDCVRAVGLLIDYTVAWFPYLRSALNRSRVQASHRVMLKRFAKAILNGTTIIENGQRVDGVGLFWPPRRQIAAKRMLSALNNFLVSSSIDEAGWRAAASSASPDALTGLRIAYQETVQRKKSLLAHLPNAASHPLPGTPFGGMFAANPDGRRTYRFPVKYIWPLLFEGFKSLRTQESDVTAELIAFLLFAGGSRLSELFHTWVGDLQWIDGKPLLFLHHPRDSEVRSADATISRNQFLQRQNRVPRNMQRKRGHAGFKGLAGEKEGAELIWLPIDELVDELASRLLHYVAKVRPSIMRLRKAKGLPDHNYLFVGSGRMFGENTNAIGEPYTIEAFRSSWGAAIKRLSILYDDPELVVSKRRGTTPHGARHFYGTFLKSIGLDGDLIAKCMHHKSPFSHLRYTELTPNEINAILENKSENTSHVTDLRATVTQAIQRQADRARVF